MLKTGFIKFYHNRIKTPTPQKIQIQPAHRVESTVATLRPPSHVLLISAHFLNLSVQSNKLLITARCKVVLETYF